MSGLLSGSTTRSRKLRTADISDYVVATDTKVSAAIARVVDSAPSTLDTLGELATALGAVDTTFATSVVLKTGSTMTGTLTAPAIATTALSLGGAAVSSSAADINKIGGLSSTKAELDRGAGVVAGTISNGKNLVASSTGGIAGISDLACSSLTLGGTALSSASSINSAASLLSGITAGTVSNSKPVIASSTGGVSGLGAVSCASLTASGAVAAGSISLSGTALPSATSITSAVALIPTANGTSNPGKALVPDSNNNVAGISEFMCTIARAGTKLETPLLLNLGQIKLSSSAADVLIEGATDIRLNSSALKINNVTMTSTAAELNKLTGCTASSADLSKLAGASFVTADLTKLGAITASAAEINRLAGTTFAGSDLTKLGSITASASEISRLAGSSFTTADLTKLGSITVSAAQINAAAAGTVTTAMIAPITGVTAGTATANKALITDASNNIAGVGQMAIGTIANNTGSALTIASSGALNMSSNSGGGVSLSAPIGTVNINATLGSILLNGAGLVQVKNGVENMAEIGNGACLFNALQYAGFAPGTNSDAVRSSTILSTGVLNMSVSYRVSIISVTGSVVGLVQIPVDISVMASQRILLRNSTSEIIILGHNAASGNGRLRCLWYNLHPGSTIELIYNMTSNAWTLLNQPPDLFEFQLTRWTGDNILNLFLNPNIGTYRALINVSASTATAINSVGSFQNFNLTTLTGTNWTASNSTSMGYTAVVSGTFLTDTESSKFVGLLAGVGFNFSLSFSNLTQGRYYQLCIYTLVWSTTASERSYKIVDNDTQKQITFNSELFSTNALNAPGTINSYIFRQTNMSNRVFAINNVSNAHLYGFTLCELGTTL